MSGGGKRIIPRAAWWAGFLAFGAGAIALTALAYLEKVPRVLRAHDKAAHFAIAGALVFFLDGALARRNLSVSRGTLSVAWLAVVVPAGVEEFLQRYATFRTASLGDFAADVAGATVFLWLSRRVG